MNSVVLSKLLLYSRKKIMRIHKIYLSGLLIALLAITGCAPKVYNADAFNRPNTFAIVSVNGITSGFGFSTAEEQKIASNFERIIYKELKNTKRFKLASSNKVKKSRAYRQIRGESTDGLLSMKTAKGYKKFDPKNEITALKKLNKELRLTGNIFITLSVSKEDSGLTLSGLLPIPIPVSAGKTHAKVLISIVTMDYKGNVIWQDMIEKSTEDGVVHVMGISNFNKLYTQILDVAKFASHELVKNLDANLSTRKG